MPSMDFECLKVPMRELRVHRLKYNVSPMTAAPSLRPQLYSAVVLPPIS
jgi:hypothetical protein